MTYIATSREWTFPLLEQFDQVIGGFAAQHGLDTYPNQIEVINSEQMLDAYASNGLPVMYPHWSYGKDFIQNQRQYQKGQMNLAYEIVINSSPTISYLMEENSLPMQALVIAHACYGHNAFFKGNYLFRQFTDARGIIDYLVFARQYIMDCENKYGFSEVEQVLDACHALQHYGIDRYPREPKKLHLESNAEAIKRRAEHNALNYSDLASTLPSKQGERNVGSSNGRYPADPQENILYFIEKNSPILPPWKREIVRIVRMLAQYFYPQIHTKVMNEGFATFWHYHLLYDLYNADHINDGFMMEVLESHTNVVYQSKYDRFSGFNPYALGFAMFKDIRRMAENPTAEDRQWFPDVAGKNWHEALDFAMRNFKDESFISQYLSPKLIREFKLFSIHDEPDAKEYTINATHREEDYKLIRRLLSEQYQRDNMFPSIEVYHYKRDSDRSLILRHRKFKNRTLDLDSTNAVLKNLKRLWNFPVVVESVNERDEVVATYSS